VAAIVLITASCYDHTQMTTLPSSARAVVIGGGIGGCSAAYHLASLGVSDVLLLERSTLSSGTTWHSTGNMETYRADPLVFEMVRYAAEAYPRIAAESGMEIGWRSVGRVMYTDREDRWASMQTLPELGRARGIELELLTLPEIAARLPIIATDELLGAVWVPSDARVNATDAVMALAACARARGVTIRQDARVLEILVRDGVVRGVVTAEGTVACDVVVVAAGLWSGEVVKTCGLRLPLHALEHQYLITKPVGIARDLPLFLSYDDQLYGREEVGGLMVGSLDDHAIPLSTAELPQNFSFALLNERWEQFEPYMATAMRRFPLLRTAEIRMLLNGPESFTPDGQMLLGPVPGATGLYAACGFNSNGIALAPAAGRFIAEWIVEGAPSSDVAPLDVRRFAAAQTAEPYVRERVTEIPGYHCRIHAPDADYATARDIRHSPLHGSLVAAGARFASVGAWERPAWFAHTTAGPTWLAAVAGEVGAATDAVLVIDRSADAKHVLAGEAAAAWFTRRTGSAPAAGAATVTPVFLPGHCGGIEVFARCCAWDAHGLLVIASPEQETRLSEWLRYAGLPADIRTADVTTEYALLELHGPNRGLLVSAVAAASGADSGSRGRPDAGPITVRDDHVSASTLLAVPSDRAVQLWCRLLEAGQAHGLRIGGHWAEEALRIRRGIPAFGREATPARMTGELQMLAGPAPGRAIPRTHVPRILAAFAGTMPILGFGSREVVLLGNRPIGELTSRVRLPEWPTTLALALLDPAAWHGEAVEVVADGRRSPLLPRATDWTAACGTPRSARDGAAIDAPR
jgi:glycine/D-amino acid oxidase-like deaminating enzyme